MSGILVRMGNNSYFPVLDSGTAIFALNGKRLLVHNILHAPGLAVPLYSLHTRFPQWEVGLWLPCHKGVWLPHLLSYLCPLGRHSHGLPSLH
jgi:hypothetical protein